MKVVVINQSLSMYHCGITQQAVKNTLQKRSAMHVSASCIIGEQQMGFGNPESSGVRLIKKNWQASKEIMCALGVFFAIHTEKRGGCKWVAKESHCISEDNYCFEIGTSDHGGHVINAKMKAKKSIGSPSVFKKAPKEFENDFMRKNPKVPYK
jgi:hypothetical protein